MSNKKRCAAVCIVNVASLVLVLFIQTSGSSQPASNRTAPDGAVHQAALPATAGSDEPAKLAGPLPEGSAKPRRNGALPLFALASAATAVGLNGLGGQHSSSGQTHTEQKQFGVTQAGQTQPNLQPVPEPAFYQLGLSLAMGGVYFRRRRFRLNHKENHTA